MKRLVIITTDLCNMNCPFCLFYKTRSRAKSISFKLLEKVLDEAKSLGYELISLTGGEAGLHPEFDDMVEMIVKKGFYFSIVSNGYEFRKYAELLKKYKKKFKRITFSLDSHKEEIHDKLRRKGSFKRIIEAIKLFTKEGIVVNISICLEKYNYKDIEDYVRFVTKLGVNDIRFLSTIPTEKNKDYVLTDNEREECYKKIEELRKKAKTKLVVMSSLRTADGVDFCTALNLDGIGINPKGEAVFCCDIYEKEAVLGSLEKESLFNLIKKAAIISNYLKERRKFHVYTHAFFEGFNTCWFCYSYLKKIKI